MDFSFVCHWCFRTSKLELFFQLFFVKCPWYCPPALYIKECQNLYYASKTCFIFLKSLWRKWMGIFLVEAYRATLCFTTKPALHLWPQPGRSLVRLSSLQFKTGLGVSEACPWLCCGTGPFVETRASSSGQTWQAKLIQEYCKVYMWPGVHSCCFVELLELHENKGYKLNN